MLTHQQIWGAIDALAESHLMSPSGLAKKSGLDPTTFNKSKRTTPDGKPRWPSTESLAKILHATGSSLQEFVALISGQESSIKSSHNPIPMIGFAEAGEEGSFDESGIPTGNSWKHLHLPEIEDAHAYALEVTGPAMEPLYRAGDVLVISPNAKTNPHDRVVIKTTDGQMLAKVLLLKTATTVELASIAPDEQKIDLPLKDIDWLARIIWASQ